MSEYIRQKSVRFTANTVLNRIEEGQLIVDPEFKDTHSWPHWRKSQFIESLLLGLPLQPIWCEESSSGEFFVIDGSQRLNSLCQYRRNEYPLKDLRIHKDYNNLKFDDLPYHETLSILDRTEILFVILNYDTPLELKSEFYWRLLESERRTRSQAARNFAYRNAGKLIRGCRNSISNLVEFSFSKSRLEIQANESKKDEIILICFLLIAICEDLISIRGERNVGEILDTLTIEIENNPALGRLLSVGFNESINLLVNHYGNNLRINVNALPPRVRGEDFSIVELYQFVINSHSENRYRLYPIKLSPLRVAPSSPVQKLFDDVRGMKNDF